MKKSTFIEKLIEELEIEDMQIEENTDLKAEGVLGSLANLALITIADDEFDVILSADDIKNITTVRSFMEIIGIEKFED